MSAVAFYSWKEVYFQRRRSVRASQPVPLSGIFLWIKFMLACMAILNRSSHFCLILSTKPLAESTHK
ncbi:uncharacterized protein BO66DRAFT_190644 [Aspergillus aculeatinus CBS 121060]|uniref:Uncharacterized protein n=1 Tax=Aspergillus aculeatinus CBS 121060 TaxID=1448322 RepID=A0ACD1GXR2_9EURO|nr:hypothetical protein BO66DRAFT_190644 [Aspergillus aculeatinus CBS 121060]RAH66056.1 hypothetical protein BO66DRAFT_190644 [Aspergillus aculeatinus CBS 121060]